MLIICCEVFVFLDSILQNIILEVKKNTLTFKNLCTLYRIQCMFMCQCLLIIKYDHIRQMFVFITSKWILSRDAYFSDGPKNQYCVYQADDF
jgi:hypothetical protein